MLGKLLSVAIPGLTSMVIAFWCYKWWFDVDVILRIVFWQKEQTKYWDPLPEPEYFTRDRVMAYLPLMRFVTLVMTVAWIVATIFMFISIFSGR